MVGASHAARRRAARLHIDHTLRCPGRVMRRPDLALGGIVVRRLTVVLPTFPCAFGAAVGEEERDLGGRAQRAQKEKHHHHTIGLDSGGLI